MTSCPYKEIGGFWLLARSPLKTACPVLFLWFMASVVWWCHLVVYTKNYLLGITSLAKEVMFLVALVSLSVCLFVCGQHYSNSYERIGMKFYGRVLSSTRKNWLTFGGDLGIVRWVNERKNTIVVAYPDRGEGNDPELLFFSLFFFF